MAAAAACGYCLAVWRLPHLLPPQQQQLLLLLLVLVLMLMLHCLLLPPAAAVQKLFASCVPVRLMLQPASAPAPPPAPTRQ